MWIPGGVAEIEDAIARGDLEETATFDAKETLPATSKQNPSLAIDVAAMSTAGGTLLYGVGEDEDDRLTVRAPLELAGAADRVALIVQTSIAEVPHIEFRTYELPDDPTQGYLVVVVPPSPRAPHQVTVRDDGRFYGRGAKGNRRLTEQEVALLYARRQRQEINLDARLDEVIRACPYTPEGPDDGCVYAFAQPLPVGLDIWEAAEERAGGRAALQQRLVHAARRVTTSPHEFDPSFRGFVSWHPVGADAVRMSSQPEDPPRSDFIGSLTDITFDVDGRCVLFAANATRAINEEGGRKYVFERNIAGNFAAFVASVATLFAEANYFGPVDLGVAVTNLDGAASSAQTESMTGPALMRRVATFNASTFRRVRRLGAASELQDAEGVAMSSWGATPRQPRRSTAPRPGRTTWNCPASKTVRLRSPLFGNDRSRTPPSPLSPAPSLCGPPDVTLLVSSPT
jgi:hypothetical protein